MEMFNHIIAIGFIYFCTTLAWYFLAGVTNDRTQNQDFVISKDVAKLWGTQQTQKAPEFYLEQGNTRYTLPIESTDATANLTLEHRQKGMLWYSTYKVAFNGIYRFVNTTAQKRTLYADFKLPTKDAVYDDLQIKLGKQALPDVSVNDGMIRVPVEMEPGQSQTFAVGYRSQGLSNWHYSFGADTVANVKNFNLGVTTNFDNPDFTGGSMSPTSKQRLPHGWKLHWHYTNLLTGYDIGILMPNKLNPGPWVSQVTQAAPVSMFLFFFVMFMLTTIKGLKVHPINYFFIGCGFFSFHLLLAYSADHLPIEIAFIVCSVVSIFLVVSYMRLVVSNRFAFVDVGLTQFIYLVVFSYTFFFEQYTGLAITVLSILTLYVTMQCTARIDWSKALNTQFATTKGKLAPVAVAASSIDPRNELIGLD
jgi:inner membrane protein involved in colicin E2 resistance